jgi:hypothetical protein
MASNAKSVDEVVGENLRRLRGAEPQDAVGRRARAGGLPWSRSTIAQLELGTKTVDVGELVLLAHALQVSVRDLLRTDGMIQLSPTMAMTSKGLCDVLAGKVLHLTTSPRARVSITASAGSSWGATGDVLLERGESIQDLATPTKLRARAERLQRLERILPRISNLQLGAALEAAHGETERKAARTLHVDDPAEVAVAALRLWGRSLTQERDARVVDAAAPDASPRTLQALRGHVTRHLLEEIEPIVRKAQI